MRSRLRAIVILLLACALLALFVYNADLRGVVSAIVNARPEWLTLALATMVLNLALRAWRWQYLLEPLGSASFGSAFRATVVGFAASSILPARAGEVIRPYMLARHERLSATGVFATVILERVLDMLTVLALLAVFVLFTGHEGTAASELAFQAVTWAGVVAGVASVIALAALFVLAGNPRRLAATLGRLEKVLPSKLAGLLARVAEKFAHGLAAVRRPDRLMFSIVLSVPLWLSIALGVWAVAEAFRLSVPFTGSFLVVALLVIGVAVPTPGAVGGFHAAFRYGATTFFSAPGDDAVGAAIVLHAITIAPTLLLGLWFAAQEGVNLGGLRRLADEAEPGPTA